MQSLSPVARGLRGKIGQRHLVCKHRQIEGLLMSFMQTVSLALAGSSDSCSVDKSTVDLSILRI